MQYEELFERATGNKPFPYQVKLATSDDLPQLIDIPTGCGKTVAVVLSWLWRRRYADDEVREKTPRRLVYCLPMRVLVEQTRDNIRSWLEKLGILAESQDENGSPQDDHREMDGWAKEKGDYGNRIAVTILMGGEDKDEWDLHPDMDAIIIGTQDMLLSRAMNRGYGMSKYRWPMHFGLLNNDSLWIMDEIQLMGVGVETTSQMDAFRRKLGSSGNCRSIWMSATTDKAQLKTVDQESIDRELKLSVEDNDFPLIKQRRIAPKDLIACDVRLNNENSGSKEYYENLSNIILDEHVKGSLTLVILNTVDRAQGLYSAVKGSENCPANIALLHSRFRKHDRDKNLEILEKEGDRLIISTQVVEAGVDLDSRTLFTELAPWPSLVQRFGRCNRKGVYEEAKILLIDVEEDSYPPYEKEDMDTARSIANGRESVSLKDLEGIQYEPHFIVRPVIRRKDILELFDTTPDLSGNDIDISRYVRDGEEKDVQVFWRDFEELPPDDMKRPVRDELCSVSIARISKFLNKNDGYIWDPLDSKWRKLGNIEARPGLMILLSTTTGGYDTEIGWTGTSLKKGEKVEIYHAEDKVGANESNDGDNHSYVGKWISIVDHCKDVADHVGDLCGNVGIEGSDKESVRVAGFWHDVGKAHEAFQNMLFDGIEDTPSRETLYAKSSEYIRSSYFTINGDQRQKRKHFRHELASALAFWKYKGTDRDALATYLIASHHGKVRQSIRSLPEEIEPKDINILFARGVWGGDKIPRIDGITDEDLEIDLSPMIMGKGSWLEMSLGLLKKYGPFKLAYMEALMKASDEMVSKSYKEVKY